MNRSGIADLPLHGGHVPSWLAHRMTELGTAIAEQVTLAYALLADAICSLLIALGILTRPAAVILFVNVLVALVFIHPWEQRVLFYVAYYALIVFSGAGRYSLDYLYYKEPRKA